jgi:hypothetical protein
MLRLSSDFERLYCDPSVFVPFSRLLPISFERVLPFQPDDTVVDDFDLLVAEEAHLAGRNDDTRRNVVEAYARCGLLPEEDAAHVNSAIDYFDADFFDLMGLVYANAGMFRCALRWYRELIVELETQHPDSCSDRESVYASAGYCLCSLGLFPETIAWSKACLGPRPAADAVGRALIGYEAQLAGGMIQALEHSGPRTRYTVSALDPALASQVTPRLKAAMNAFAPFQEIYIDWISPAAPSPESPSEAQAAMAEIDGGSLPRHKMNLIVATCGQADALVENGRAAEARRWLFEAAMLEPEAGIVWDRIKALD